MSENWLDQLRARLGLKGPEELEAGWRPSGKWGMAYYIARFIQEGLSSFVITVLLLALIELPLDTRGLLILIVLWQFIWHICIPIVTSLITGAASPSNRATVVLLFGGFAALYLFSTGETSLGGIRWPAITHIAAGGILLVTAVLLPYFYWNSIKQDTAAGLVGLLEHPDPGIRKSAMQALAGGEEELVIDGLIRMLHDSNSGNRQEALKILMQYKDGRVIEGIIGLLDDKAPWMRLQASDALKRMTGESFGHDKVKWQRWWKREKSKWPS
jgi:hypothetical protein